MIVFASLIHPSVSVELFHHFWNPKPKDSNQRHQISPVALTLRDTSCCEKKIYKIKQDKI